MNIKNFDIYLSRLISALCLFLILAEANVWLSPINNTILVLGYRLFILFTPVLFLLFKNKVTFFAFIIAELGIMFWLLHYNCLGTLLFAIGISISGYMLKYYASFSTKGAAGNKIALNLGSIFSGILVASAFNQEILLIFCFIIMFISHLAFLKYYRRDKLYQFKIENKHFQIKQVFSRKGIAWMLVGFVIGVKLISMVSILPQIIITTHDGTLTSWYGTLLVLNSIIVVIFQLPIMNKIQKHSKIKSIIPLAIAMILITFSCLLGVGKFINACVWTLVISIIECTVSYLDKLSQDDGMLLIKEAAVGIGSGATVLCSRFFDLSQGVVTIGLLSIVFLIVSIVLFQSHSNLICNINKMNVSMEIS